MAVREIMECLKGDYSLARGKAENRRMWEES